jgi:hypothetical protein
MQQPRYIESTPAVRAKLVGAAVASLLIAAAFDYWVKPKLNWIASLSTCESLPYVRIELLFGVAIAACIGLVAYKQARQTWKLEQSPLPGTWVWSRTRVRTGAYAKAVAVALFTMSAFFIGGPLALIVQHRLYLVLCIPQACSC